MAQSAIATRNLTKTYHAGNGESVAALRGVDLAVAGGEIYALLGPNGAGKTTTIAILTTLLAPTSGTASVAGYNVSADPDQVRRRIGVTFQEVVLDQELTGRQTLDFHGRLYGQPQHERERLISSLSDMVELSDALDRRISGYSGGMKRRLELARGLMTQPEVLFLDEPTQGLDPQNRAGIWAYIQNLRQESGITVLLTTHYMEEAEALADRVGIIDEGKLSVEGEPAHLVREMGKDIVTMCGRGNLQSLLARFRSEWYVDQIADHARPDGEWCAQIGVDNGDQRLLSLMSLAANHENITLTSVRISRPTLADVFLAHTGHALRDI